MKEENKHPATSHDLEELKKLKDIKHTNIVRLLDWFLFSDGEVAVVNEFINASNILDTPDIDPRQL